MVINVFKIRYQILLMIVASTLVLYGLWWMNNRSINGVSHDLISETGSLNGKGRALINAATRSKDDAKVAVLIRHNPGLFNFLSREIQSFPIDNHWSRAESIEFATQVRLLQGIVNRTHQNSGPNSVKWVDQASYYKLSNYLQAFINSRKRAGHGAIVNLDNIDVQMAVFEAYRLNQSLQSQRKLLNELTELVAWYQIEMEAQARIQQFPRRLLHYAWELVEQLRQVNDVDRINPESLVFNTTADLLRLINHPDPKVQHNSARLLGLFTPSNAVTTLRYQLIKAKDNEMRFLLLEAMKSYSQHRDQLEAQLKQMLNMTEDTAFQNKIVEVMNHLNG